MNDARLGLGLLLHALSACVLVCLVGGCPALIGGQGDRPEGFRLVDGKLQAPEEDLLGRQVTGMQIAGLALDGAGGVDVFPSAVFDPAGDRAQSSFLAPVHGERSFVVVLQVPSASTRGPGAFLGVLRFEDGLGGETTLIPPGLDDIQLGTLTVTRGTRVPGDNLLVAGSANNPLAQVDTDDDGTVDALDSDDDDDGTDDGSDSDRGGDGVEDALQILAALPDTDTDGVPDLLE